LFIAKDNSIINEAITVPQVRLINENGDNIGVIGTKEALAMAQEAELDLVAVAPDAKPPVCRIMDFGKQKYRMKKKQHQSRVKQHQTQLKALRLSPVIEEHDIQVKLRRAREFLARGDRVTFNMMFRGRQMLHKEVGIEVMKHIATSLEDVAKPEAPPRMEGRRLWMVVAPHKQ
jgi:translation initiation factor IF-3